MNRRGFLKLLAVLPFVPKLAEVAAKAIKPAKYVGMDLALSGSDQTSMWLVNWSPQPSLVDLVKRSEYNVIPVVEMLHRQNTFLQDKVWKEDAPIGHKVTWGSRWR